MLAKSLSSVNYCLGQKTANVHRQGMKHCLVSLGSGLELSIKRGTTQVSTEITSNLGEHSGEDCSGATILDRIKEMFFWPRCR